MNDTPPEIHQKQRDIIMSKSPKERFEMGIQMMEDARSLVEDGIRMSNPGILALELKIEVFKRYYKNDFLPEELDVIIQSLKTSQT